MVCIKAILNAISDEECVVLVNGIGEAVIDKDDVVDEINGKEIIHLQVGPNQTVPIPNDFNKAIIMHKAEFAFESMMKKMCGE